MVKFQKSSNLMGEESQETRALASEGVCKEKADAWQQEHPGHPEEAMAAPRGFGAEGAQAAGEAAGS